MRYSLRISLPDQPGGLAMVAGALGAAGLDVVSFAVVERADGLAVDDVGVEGAVSDRVLRRILEQVPGVAVEALSEGSLDAGGLTATALAAQLAEHADRGWQRLVEGLTAAAGASWVVALGDSAAGLQTLAASAGAPEVSPGLRLPFLPLARPCRLPPAGWMPTSWLGQADSERAEFAATPLSAPYEAVVVGRSHGPRFRQAELDRIAEIVRVAVAVSASAAVPV